MKTTYNKNDLRKEMETAMYSCQSLFNIHALGRWSQVEDAGNEALNEYNDDIIMNKEQFDKACKNVLGAVYATAEGD